MVYEIDFELPIYGGEHVLRFSPSVALQGKSINFFKGSYDALFPILEEQLTRLKKAGERVKVYVNGDFVDFSRSPVLREFSKIQKYVIDFSVSDILSSDFMNLEKNPVLRTIKDLLEKRVEDN